MLRTQENVGEKPWVVSDNVNSCSLWVPSMRAFPYIRSTKPIHFLKPKSSYCLLLLRTKCKLCDTIPEVANPKLQMRTLMWWFEWKWLQ